jgi:UDP-2-acetamido-3-amino-2,3-dideoxy-glucuronate N-acetyltransferase
VSRKDEYKTTLVRRGASHWRQLPPWSAEITIGRYAFIGAGSVVTKDVPDYALMYGNPAALTRMGLQLRNQAHVSRTVQLLCRACGAAYVKQGNLVTEDLAGAPK